MFQIQVENALDTPRAMTGCLFRLYGIFEYLLEIQHFAALFEVYNARDFARRDKTCIHKQFQIRRPNTLACCLLVVDNENAEKGI